MLVACSLYEGKGFDFTPLRVTPIPMLRYISTYGLLCHALSFLSSIPLLPSSLRWLSLYLIHLIYVLAYT
jgi:hypothetical protein